MAREPLIRATLDNYEKIRLRSEVWSPIIEIICQRHQIPVGRLFQFRPGSNIIFAVGAHYVVKLFCETQQYESERLLLSRLGRELGVEIPQIHADGDIENWPYLVMTRLHGKRLDACWWRLHAVEKTAIVEDLGRILARLHQVPTEGMEELEQLPELTPERISEIVSQERENGVPEHLLVQIPPFFESVQPLLLPDTPRVITLMDAQPEHLLCHEKDGRWRITGFVDFADATLAYCEYDFPLPIIRLMPAQPQLLRSFLLAYGYDESQLTESLGRRFLAVLINAGFLTDALSDHFGPTPIQWLEQIQTALFTLRSSSIKQSSN